MRIENKEGPETVLRINGIVIFFTFMTFLAGSFARECECYDWRTRHPEWIWCDDFETEKNLHTNYQDVSSNGLRVSDTDAFEGSYALEQRYDSGQVDAGWISWFYDSALGKSYGKSYDEIYVRWYHKFERGFTGVPPKMARIRSLGPEWEKRFSVHYWVESGSPNKEIVADVHVPYSSQANSLGWLPIARSNFYYNNPDNIGRWVCHEMYVKKNTPGKADGAYRFWADNTPIVERTNVDLVGSTNY